MKRICKYIINVSLCIVYFLMWFNYDLLTANLVWSLYTTKSSQIVECYAKFVTDLVTIVPKLWSESFVGILPVTNIFKVVANVVDHFLGKILKFWHFHIDL